MRGAKCIGQFWQCIQTEINLMQSISSSLEAKRHFEKRSPENIENLLLARGLEGNLLVSALKEWEELAKTYEIESGKLRPDDHIIDLVNTDWFGDRGLMLEARLVNRGIKRIDHDMTVLQLVLLLSNA